MIDKKDVVIPDGGAGVQTRGGRQHPDKVFVNKLRLVMLALLADLEEAEALSPEEMRKKYVEVRDFVDSGTLAIALAEAGPDGAPVGKPIFACFLTIGPRNITFQHMGRFLEEPQKYPRTQAQWVEYKKWMNTVMKAK